MLSVYLDQNAVINLGHQHLSADEAEVRRRIQAREATLILSPAHWVETAEGRSERNSRELAQFIDTLSPRWLLERISLHRLEIRAFLQGLLFEQVRDMAICNTVTEVVADLSGVVGPVQIVNTEDLVLELRRNQRGRAILRRAYSQNERASRENRRHFRAGRITPELERRLERQYLRRIGRIVPYSSEDMRLAEIRPEAIRSIVVEWEATKEYWRRGGQMGRRRFHDLQHIVVAIPYVDFVLTYDIEMRAVISAVCQVVPFPTAAIVGSIRELLEAIDQRGDVGSEV